MKSVTEAKAIFNQALKPYIDAIQAEFDAGTVSFFFKRNLGVCSGLKGLVRARGFIQDLQKAEVDSIKGILQKLAERDWGARSQNLLAAALLNIFELEINK